jgi:hypothetical protein
MRCGSGGTPTGALVGGKVIDPAAVATALKQLLARTEIVHNRAMIVASDAVATFRVLKLPPAATDQDVNAAVAKELTLDPERMATMWLDLHSMPDHRVIYAVTWDRTLVKNITDAVRQAGLEPTVVELKSACIARAVAEPSCVVLDMSSEPVEIFLIDRHVPQLWHNFDLNVAIADDVAPALGGPIEYVLRFNRRRHDGEFGPGSPVFISGEQMLPAQLVTNLASMIGHRVEPLPAPARVPPDIRHTTYLACLGLLMRRR